MSDYLHTEWKRLCDILSKKDEYTVFRLPSFRQEDKNKVVEWFSDHGFEPLRAVYHPENRQTIPPTFEDGLWYIVPMRGGDWLIIFDKNIALEFRLVFGYETCHPLAPMIRSKL